MPFELSGRYIFWEIQETPCEFSHWKRFFSLNTGSRFIFIVQETTFLRILREACYSVPYIELACRLS